MPILIDYTQLTILERAALAHAANLNAPANAPRVTGEAHLEQNVQAMLAAAVDGYVQNQLPALRTLAVLYLNQEDATKEEVGKLLGARPDQLEAQPAERDGSLSSEAEVNNTEAVEG